MSSQPELSKETSVLLAKDMTFEQIMHKKTAEGKVGFTAMLGKDKEAQKAASADYFRHWDNKAAKDETKETRDVCNRAFPVNTENERKSRRNIDLETSP